MRFLFCSILYSNAEKLFSCLVFHFQDVCSSQFQVYLWELNGSKLTSLSILTSLLFELVESLIEFTFNLLFHLCHLDLIVIFKFGNFLLGANTVLIPFKTLDFINRHFLKMSSIDFMSSFNSSTFTSPERSYSLPAFLSLEISDSFSTWASCNDFSAVFSASWILF